MITTIILSKDRPAQLDLLLRSIERNGDGLLDWKVVWQGEYLDDGYQLLWQPMRFAWEGEPGRKDGFEFLVRALLDEADDFVCFACDDGILYRPLPTWLDPWGPALLCFSLRLGENTRVCYPTGLDQAFPRHWTTTEAQYRGWEWAKEPQEPGVSDFGYPGSIDGHVFRTDDVRRMLTGKSFPNPTALECALVAGCAELAVERPLMACFPHSVYVGNPVNRVSEQSGVRYGTRYPVTAAECNERFLRGERIDLDALDFSQVDGAHTEIELLWK